MSRTALFADLRRALALAGEAARRGLSPDDERLSEGETRGISASSSPSPCPLPNGERGGSSISRRAFLGGMTAGALAACGVGASKPAGMSHPADVIVVGGGLAGLVCAFRLRQGGARVRLFEAQGRIGGRVLTLRDFFADGQIVELGGEFASSTDERLLALAQELELELDDVAPDPTLPSAVTWHFGGRSYSDREMVAALVPIAAKARGDLAARQHAGPVYYEDPNGLEALDNLSLTQWLDGAGASGWIRALIESTWTAEYGVEPDGQSALNLLLAQGGEPLRTLGGRERRYRIRGGADLLPRALALRLQNAVETGARVEAAQELPSWSWRCTVRRDQATTDLTCTHLVLAVPFPLLREIKLDTKLPQIKQFAIDKLLWGTSSKLCLGFEARPWQGLHHASGTVATDLGFQTAWEASRGRQSEHGVLVAQAGGRRGAELGAQKLDDQARLVLGDLDLVFPGLATARGRERSARLAWPDHPFARGSRSVYGPSQWTLFGGVQGERIGRLHFAGEHTSYRAQGTMEGAIESGERVAREILEQPERGQT